MKRLLYLFLLLMSVAALPAAGQQMNIKTNILYDATTTISLGAEIGLGKKTSLDVSGGYNPWEFSSTKWMKLWMVQPEFRYWLCERFNRHFFGVHLHGGQYNFSGIKSVFSDNMEDYNYQGDFYGAGVSYGYQWILSNRWGIEATIGGGYVHLDYDRYPCAQCGSLQKSDSKDYWGLTKLGVSLVYYIF